MSSETESRATDAISLLAADHRKVEACFAELPRADSIMREEELAREICAAVRQHTQIDQSLVYPAFLAATGDRYKCQAALDEEREMLELLGEIENSTPTEEGFFAKIHILCVLFAHHVRREERERGVFSEVQHSGKDLSNLGRELQQRTHRDCGHD